MGAKKFNSTALGRLWDDYTGVTAVEKQNAANLELAKYQTQVQEEMYNKYSSPDALMRQYKEAGLNPNLVYGSASAGQGNVPSFNAPHVERQLSISDKMNKALSLLSGLSNVAQGVYQASAAREGAEQAGLKTLNDLVNYRRNARDYNAENEISGYHEQTFWKRLFKKRRGRITQAEIEALYPDGYVDNPKYTKYLSAAREKFFSEAARPGVQNRVDTAKAVGQEIDNLYLEKYLQTRNDQQYLNYEIDSEFKKATSFSDIGAQWLQPILKLLSSLIQGRRK